MKLLLALLAVIGVASAFHAAVKFESTDNYCIVLDAVAKGYITYEDNNEGPKKYEFTVDPVNYTNGKCSGVVNKTTVETIVLGFYPSNYTPTAAAAAPWELTINFKENTVQTNNAYNILSYSLNAILYPELFPNATHTSVLYSAAPAAELEWHGEETRGFTCSKSGLSFVNDTYIGFENLKVVAFGLLEHPDFPASQNFEQCKLDMRTSDVVPIVVGACLAGLVIVVLIAYLIGRARAKRQGYASV
uniref:Lysosome-associated membrane glycoprotein n=1 Tax=Panagrolaimus superbus TaxID=310955 RepID=A0A914YX84_9BILA